MAYYERRLPHWQPDDVPLFVTWRLHGTLPKGVDAPEKKKTTDPSWKVLDRHLNDAPGPRWLQNTDVAHAVADTFQYAEKGLSLYRMMAWVIMPNHVHLLLEPKVPLSKITMSVKNYSAREANRILNRSGAFWQDESYDHWARSVEEQGLITNYIEYNPVEAGLVLMPENWPWSSASHPSLDET